MNKAFVREPDDTGQLHCPACGSLGTLVHRETWAAFVRDGEAGALAETAFFCPFPRCDVVYFDMFERRVTTAELVRSVWPKDPDAPICGCFGLTRQDVEADIEEGGVRRVRALVERAKSPEAQCHGKAANGQNCTAEVQRYFMKLRGGA